MRKIRIAHVITRMDWGGSPDIVRILCDSLDPETFDAWLVIGKTEYPSAKTTEFLEKFKDKTIVIPQLKRDIDVLNDFLALVRLCLLLQRHRFDIVHTHTAKAGFLGRLAAKLAGVKKVIHTPHGNNFYGYFGALASKLVVMLEKFADYCTDITIVLTELEKKELIEYGVSRNKKIAVVKSGLEFEAYGNCSVNISQKKGELGIEDNSQNIVAMIGRLELVKGPEYFIKAAKLVLEKYPSVTFLMVGDGSLREKLEAKVGAAKFKEVCGCSIKSMFEDEKRTDINLTAKQMKEMGIVTKITKLTPADVTATDGNTLTVAMNASGIFTLA